MKNNKSRNIFDPRGYVGRLLKTTCCETVHLKKTVFLFCILIAVGCSIFIVKIACDRKNQNIEIMAREAQLRINAIVSSRINHLRILQAVAKEFLENEVVERTAVENRLRVTDEKGWELQPSEQHHPTSLGRITGLGNPEDLAPWIIDEIAMAERLNQVFEATKMNLGYTPFVYYLSQNNFWNLYPRNLDDFTMFTKEHREYEYYTMGIPENNKDRDIFWTKPHIDAGGHGFIVTAGIPLYHEDRFYGNLCVDMTFEDISIYLKSSPFTDYKISLIDNHNQVVSSTIRFPASPDDEQPKISHLPGEEDLRAINGARNNGFFRYNNNRVYTLPLTSAPWQIVHRESLKVFIISIFFDALFPVSILLFILLIVHSFLRNSRLRILMGEAKLKADAANQAKSEFLANMSHEIQNPINSILGFSKILESLEPDPEKAHYIDLIRTYGNNLLSLTNDILDLSKIEAGKMELQHSEISVMSMFRQMEAIFGHKLLDKGVAFIIECNSSVPDSLMLDETRLRQVLINLIGNAVKFTDAGNIKLRAWSTASDSGSCSRVDLTIEVADTGIGIPVDEQQRIFRAFEPVNGQKSTQYGGTGLGLAIAGNLVALMEGEIDIQSQYGEGSIFRVFLPGVEVVTTESKSSFKEPIPRLTDISFDPATILIADDTEINRDILIALLAKCNFNIIEASNGSEAIEKAKEFRPDLIILDMMMPVMNGYEASKRLKLTPGLKDIPIIAFTATASKEKEAKIRGNCDGYLSRPASKATIFSELVKFLPYSQEGEDCTRR